MTPKLALTKSAIDFALENYDADAITQAEKSIAAFKAGGFDPVDLPVWNSISNGYVAQFCTVSVQKLPSEFSAQAVKVAQSNVSALTNKQ